MHSLPVCSQKPQERPAAGEGRRRGRWGLAATSQTGSTSAPAWVAATKASFAVKRLARWQPCHRPEPARSAGGPSIVKTRLRRHTHREWEKRLSPPAKHWRTANAKLLGLSCRESVETARFPDCTCYSTLLRANVCPLIIQTKFIYMQPHCISRLSVCHLMKQIGDTRSASDVFAQASMCTSSSLGSTSM